MTASILLCPVCKESLQVNESNKSLSCENNHSFDRARQGYLNLLLAHKKKSKNPGDNQEMVIARQAFLNSDFYRPISDSLNKIVVNLATKQDHTINVLDIGCGEGYYSQRLHNSLSESDIDHKLYGLDISKDAIIAAAKRAKAAQASKADQYKNSEWLVASAIDIPLQDNSIDIATCLFTRLMPESYHKVIKHDGYFICVNTGEKHLIELREKLYDQITKVEFDPIKNMGEDFELVDHQQVSYQNTLSSQQQIQDLLLMTPHNWRTKAENKESLSTLEELTVTIDAQIHVFKAKEKAKIASPWGKITEETIKETTPVNIPDIPEMPVDKVTELPATGPDEMPLKAFTEMPVTTPTEIPDKKSEANPSKEKFNPWLK